MSAWGCDVIPCCLQLHIRPDHGRMDGWAILSHYCSGLCSETFLGPPGTSAGTQAKGGSHADMRRAFAQLNI